MLASDPIDDENRITVVRVLNGQSQVVTGNCASEPRLTMLYTPSSIFRGSGLRGCVPPFSVLKDKLTVFLNLRRQRISSPISKQAHLPDSLPIGELLVYKHDCILFMICCKRYDWSVVAKGPLRDAILAELDDLHVGRKRGSRRLETKLIDDYTR